MAIGIYGIFDGTNGDCLYIGLSRNIELRWRGHLKELRNGKHKCRDFLSWWQQHDEDETNLNFRVLQSFGSDPGDCVLNLAEQFWFMELGPKFFNKYPSEYEKWSHSEETKAKISKSNARITTILAKTCKACKVGFTVLKQRKHQKYCSKVCSSSAIRGKSDSLAPQIIEF